MVEQAECNSLPSCSQWALQRSRGKLWLVTNSLKSTFLAILNLKTIWSFFFQLNNVSTEYNPDTVQLARWTSPQIYLSKMMFWKQCRKLQALKSRNPWRRFFQGLQCRLLKHCKAEGTQKAHPDRSEKSEIQFRQLDLSKLEASQSLWTSWNEWTRFGYWSYWIKRI